MPAWPDKREEAFAQALVLAPHKSASAIYREVFPKSKRWKDSTVHVHACLLKKKVKSRIDELIAESVERTEIVPCEKPERH